MLPHQKQPAHRPSLTVMLCQKRLPEGPPWKPWCCGRISAAQTSKTPKEQGQVKSMAIQGCSQLCVWLTPASRSALEKVSQTQLAEGRPSQNATAKPYTIFLDAARMHDGPTIPKTIKLCCAVPQRFHLSVEPCINESFLLSVRDFKHPFPKSASTCHPKSIPSAIRGYIHQQLCIYHNTTAYY